MDALTYFRDSARTDQFVTSNYVLAESVTWLAYHGYRNHAAPFRQRIAANEALSRLEVIWVDRAIEAEAWTVFEQFDDQRLSFVDCSSIAICRARGIDRAFSFDRHFTIAGIPRVPNP
jgi:predicted nucleic acid-binding protein